MVSAVKLQRYDGLSFNLIRISNEMQPNEVDCYKVHDRFLLAFNCSDHVVNTCFRFELD